MDKHAIESADNKKKEELSKVGASILITAFLGGIYLALIVHFLSLGEDAWAGIAQHCITIWKNKGIELTAIFASICLLIPSISFKSDRNKKKFIARNRVVVYLTVIYLFCSVLALMIEPLSCQLFQAISNLLKSKCEWILVLMDLFFLAMLLLYPTYVLFTLYDIFSLYREDIETKVCKSITTEGTMSFCKDRENQKNCDEFSIVKVKSVMRSEEEE